ncbi:UvrD-helicase domain-containing protein [Devosia sp.]|uniref:UvrD-helicase domain-containing protein n=1 Tax=Devosia sp. TaxID=1871048 RepID=UPI0027373EFF|nr:UvrD-helicase domain-containing protein [Devosia sp.]MDP2779156.1 UvrD-helicase domain-containing protein [Devosia sp.]
MGESKVITATPEQVGIRDSSAHQLVVNAFAGTSKTTTCEMYASRRQNKRILYIVFNKANQIEAQARFPRHVKCATAHGLAYAKFGARYAHKLAGNLRATDVLAALNLGNNYVVAQGALNLLMKYMVSARDDIADVAADEEFSSTIAEVARDLWKKMKDVNDSSVPMLHDGYLKLFQLSRPLLPYDIILLDEAQDTNPVLSSIISMQPCDKVFVGDVHQQIYLFRGAANAMAMLAGERHVLTRSFRFGADIADVASRILHEKGEDGSIIGAGQDGAIDDIDLDRPFAHICRTNAGIFSESIDAVRAGRKIGFVGGFKSYRFNMILDAHNLKFGGAIKDPYIRSFGDFSKLETVAAETEDPELKMLSKVVTEYGEEIPALVEKVRSSEVDINQAKIIFMTAHKSKGLEFDQVRLANDFYAISKYHDGRKAAQSDSELANLDVEMNLLYVSATRARRILEPNDTIVESIINNGYVQKASHGI